MNTQHNYSVVLSGGGTGGHLFPALALAETLRAEHPALQCHFIGARGRMEMKRVPAYGFPIIGLWISGYQTRALWKNLWLPLKLLWSLIQVYRLLRLLKPHVVIGTGGYASLPVVYMACRMGIPTVIHEANTRAGRSNRWLGKRVNVVSVSFLFDDPRIPQHKILRTGTPVRAALRKAAQQAAATQAKQYFQLPTKAQVLLLLGGSLGASPLNEAFLAYPHKLIQLPFYLIWQTGDQHFDSLQQKLSQKNYPRLRVYPFIEAMDKAYTAADLVVCRAGAVTLAELMMFERPSVLVPSPYVTENHQYLNAKQMEKMGAAHWMPQSQIQQALLDEAIALMRAPRLRNKMTQALNRAKAQYPIKNASEELLKHIRHLLQNETNPSS